MTRVRMVRVAMVRVLRSAGCTGPAAPAALPRLLSAPHRVQSGGCLGWAPLKQHQQQEMGKAKARPLAGSPGITTHHHPAGPALDRRSPHQAAQAAVPTQRVPHALHPIACRAGTMQ
jgi:hypothetical protein